MPPMSPPIHTNTPTYHSENGTRLGKPTIVADYKPL